MKLYSQPYVFLAISLLLCHFVSAQVEQEVTEQDSIANLNSGNSFEQSFFKALSERGIENYDKAVEILTELEKEHKDEAVVYFQLGLNYFDLESYDLALGNFEIANNLKPKDYHIKEAIFKVYEQQKQYPQAIDYAQDLALKNPEYHEILANLYLITNRYKEALTSLDKADKAQGFDAHKDELRAVIFKEYNTPQVAVDYYEKRIELEPYNPLNNYRLIRFLIEQKNYDKAISATENALKKHPRFSRFYVLQTQIYTELDQINLALEALENVVTDKFLEEKFKVEAITYFKSYVETHPEAEDDFINILNIASQTAEDNSSFLDLGLYYFETDKQRSMENFKKAKAQNPQDFQILKYISVLQFQLNQYEKAIITADKALEIYPTQAIFMLVKGESLVMQTQYNEAKSVLLEALSYVFEENETMQKLYESLSRAYQGLNETDKAAEYREKANALQEKLN